MEELVKDLKEKIMEYEEKLEALKKTLAIYEAEEKAKKPIPVKKPVQKAEKPVKKVSKAAAKKKKTPVKRKRKQKTKAELATEILKSTNKFFPSALNTNRPSFFFHQKSRSSNGF